ncbi:MAG: transport-associated protein [Gemmatimonadetes bacterium]|nr:transport-associated protein [Gemmatimonadota bacterium]
MARDFEDIHDLESLNDVELRELVRTHLAAHNGLDVDDFSVRIDDGVVVLAGRVGTEGERRIAEHVVTDSLGVMEVRNELVVDPIRRAESPLDIDEHLAEEERTEGLQLGDRPVSFSPESEHLADGFDEESEGTTDVLHAIENGQPWIPPESPTQEGLDGQDAYPGSGENH